MWRCFRIICTFELWYRMKSKRENHIMSLEEMKKKDSTTVHDYSMSVTSIINFYWFTATKFRYRNFVGSKMMKYPSSSFVQKKIYRKSTKLNSIVSCNCWWGKSYLNWQLQIDLCVVLLSTNRKIVGSSPK